jgi:diguanylate cyclase (GGDEF)-like protein
VGLSAGPIDQGLRAGGLGLKATVRSYIAVVTVAGLATLVTFAILDIGELPVDEPAFWVLAALVVFGEMFPLLVPFHDEHEEVTTSTTFVFALLLMFGIASAVFAQGAASLIADRHRGVPWWKAAFNLSQYTLAWLAAGAVLDLVAGPFHFSDPSSFGAQEFIGIALAGLAFFVVNTELVGIALALVTGVPILRHFRSELGFYISTAAVLLSLGLIVAIVADWRVEVVPLILAPLWIAYRSAKVSLEKEYQAHHDALTGLPNRVYFTDRVAHMIGTEPGESFVVMVLDLDRFKEVNDTLGHQIGDDLLRLVGARLLATIGPDGVVARLGGDEFAVIAPSETEETASEQLRKAFEAPFLVEGLHFDIDASIGCARYPDHGTSVDDLLKAADVAMYVSKEQRRGFTLYEAALDRNDARRLQLLGELRAAIDDGEVIVHFQPEVETGTRVVVGAEALVRWQHPTLGLLSATEFVPIAESTSLISTLTEHVLRSALRECAAWRADGHDLWVAVNISVRSLYEDGFVESVARIIDEARVEPRVLMLEVTESMMVTDPARAASVLEQLHALGVGVAIDDFGTGYSSLAYLKRLPVDLLKIDRSFIANVAVDEDDLVIVRSTLDLARSLGMQSVAEGVESASVLHLLETLGCDLVQGFHLCEPMPAEALREWLHDRLHVDAPHEGGAPPDQLLVARA